MDMKTQFLDYSGLGEAVNLIKKCIADHKEILPYASLGSFPLTRYYRRNLYRYSYKFN
nr:MAG TPA: hypothetical protein [Bacteriophage sp.]